MTMPTSERHAETPRSAVRGGVVVALAVLVAVAWAIYRPESRRPFDFVDFPETLLVLQRSASFFSQVADLTSALLVHARLNLAVYVMIAAKWGVFGWWTPGWQLTRFLTMSLSVLLTFGILRRLRMSTLAALAGASVFVVAPSAVRGWIRLTAAEPAVLLQVLAATWLAAGYAALPDGSRARRRSAVALVLLGVLVVLTKEILAVAFALPLALLLTVRPSGELRAPQLDRRNAPAIVAICVAIVLAMIPSFWAYTQAPATSYGRWFGTARPGVFDWIAMTCAGLLPFLPGADAVGMALVNLGFWGVVLLGLPMSRQDPDWRGRTGWLVALAIALPMLGAAVYLPWPNFQLVYALPFVFGQALLVAAAVTLWTRRGRRSAVAATVLWGLVLTYAVPEAAGEARRVAAVQIATRSVLDAVSAERGVDSVYVVAPQAVLDQRGLFGPRLYQYAQALGQSWAPTIDVSCEAGTAAARDRPSIVVVWSDFMCGTPPGPTMTTITEFYPRLEWTHGTRRMDALRYHLMRAPHGRSPLAH